MTLRLRIFVVVAFLAVGCTVSVAVFGYKTASSELYAAAADSLYGAASELQEAARETLERPTADPDRDSNAAPSAVAAVFPERFSPQFTKVLVQVLDSRGTVVLLPPGRELPVSAEDRTIAMSDSDSLSEMTETVVLGETYLVLTAGIPGGGAVQLARSLGERDRVLQVIRDSTAAMVAISVLLAVVLAWLLGTGVVLRITRLTKAAEQVAETGDLVADLPKGSADEAGRLSHAIQRMLSALAASKEQQRRLVQDVGHELKTPLTSLRTNIEVLQQLDSLPRPELESLLADVRSEASALTDLIEEALDIASGSYVGGEMEDLALIDVATAVADSASRRHDRSITVSGDESVVSAPATGLERAVSNLVENALKYDTSGSTVEIEVALGELRVLDRGPGVSSSDKKRVFDRFFRSPSAAYTPGSGLGLSIVSDVVRSAGGTVFVRDRPGGGSVFGFKLPVQYVRPES